MLVHTVHINNNFFLIIESSSRTVVYNKSVGLHSRPAVVMVVAVALLAVLAAVFLLHAVLLEAANGCDVDAAVVVHSFVRLRLGLRPWLWPLVMTIGGGIHVHRIRKT